MNTRYLRMFAFFFIAILVASAQQPVPPLAVDPSDRTITLDVVVAEKSGKPVSGLGQRDFTLLDNKQPQKLTSFHEVAGGSSNSPLEVILLIDEANASFEHASFAREQAEKYLKQNGGQLPQPVSFAFLTDSGITTGKAPSRDGGALITEMKGTKSPLRTITRSQGLYGAGDRVQLSLHALEQIASYEGTRPGRKLVIWISPGWPLLSGPRVELSNDDKQRLFNTIVELSTLLRRARITLSSIDPLGQLDAGGLRTTYFQSFYKGVRTAKSAEIGNLGLQVIAHQSGGQVLNSSNDVAGQIAKCVMDADDFYEISFEGLPGDGPNEFHAIDVQVDRKGLSARTRAGYYAQPSEAAGH